MLVNISKLDGLSSNFTVVSFDPHGHGNSRPPARIYTKNFIKDDAADAAELMKQLFPNKKYSVLGWSDGANSAVVLSAMYQLFLDFDATMINNFG